MIFSFEKPHKVGTVCLGSKCPICGSLTVTTGGGNEDLQPDQPFYIVREATREEFAAQLDDSDWIAPNDYFYEVSSD